MLFAWASLHYHIRRSNWRCLGKCGLDIALHDTYLCSGTLHYVLSMGAVFAAFAASIIGSKLYLESGYREHLGRLHSGYFL